MRINYNNSANIACNILNMNNSNLAKSTQRLSSGLKINSAADDAAGLSIAKKMNAQIRGLQQANNNAEDGISLLNIADGAMTEVHDILQRMNELCVQSANGTNSSSDRSYIQTEINGLIEEIDRIADTTQFNAQNLLDGTFALKGFTNSENVKSFAYSDYVNTGTYSISEMKYDYYENTIISKNAETKKEEKFDVPDEDAIKNKLGDEFPDGCKVSAKDDIITISGDDNFEIQLQVNNREPISRAGLVTTTTTTAYYITKQYNNVAIIDKDTNSRYNLKELFMKKNSNAALTDDPTDNGTVQNNNFVELSNDLIEQGGMDSSKRIETIDYITTNIDKPEVKITFNDGSTKQFYLDYSIEEEVAKYGNYKKEDVTRCERQADGSYEVYIRGSATVSYTVPADTIKPPLDNYLHETVKTAKTSYTIEDLEIDITNMGGMRLQVGANEGQVIEVVIPSINTNYLGVDELDVTTEDSATEGIDIVSDAINYVSNIRSKLGAYENRLEHTVTNLDTSEENMTSAYSRIMDVDMAEEMTKYSTYQVLVQSSTSMLSHANENPQSVLRLLQ